MTTPELEGELWYVPAEVLQCEASSAFRILSFSPAIEQRHFSLLCVRIHKKCFVSAGEMNAKQWREVELRR